MICTALHKVSLEFHVVPTLFMKQYCTYCVGEVEAVRKSGRIGAQQLYVPQTNLRVPQTQQELVRCFPLPLVSSSPFRDKSLMVVRLTQLRLKSGLAILFNPTRPRLKKWKAALAPAHPRFCRRWIKLKSRGGARVRDIRRLTNRTGVLPYTPLTYAS